MHQLVDMENPCEFFTCCTRIYSFGLSAKVVAFALQHWIPRFWHLSQSFMGNLNVKYNEGEAGLGTMNILVWVWHWSSSVGISRNV